jgi:hypothetical protein
MTRKIPSSNWNLKIFLSNQLTSKTVLQTITISVLKGPKACLHCFILSQTNISISFPTIANTLYVVNALEKGLKQKYCKTFSNIYCSTCPLYSVIKSIKKRDVVLTFILIMTLIAILFMAMKFIYLSTKQKIDRQL